MSDVGAAIAYLRSPLAIRARCETICEAALAGRLAHFGVDLGKLPAVVDRVSAITRAAYPDLRVPVWSRTAHMNAGGANRTAALDARLAHLPADDRARAWVDLLVVSVLLDAATGEAWTYREPETGISIGRSEGVAIASLRAFEAGLFSAHPRDRLRVDARALLALDLAHLAAALQVTADNPIAGLEGRVALLRALGAALAAAPRIFAGGRPGGIVDVLDTAEVPAPAILRTLLEGLAPIWPPHTELAGANLGDTWRHPAAGGTGPSAGLVPFHGVSQWLAYAVFEPLERTGRTIGQRGALTGLPDTRNGGLLVDLGAIVPLHSGLLAAPRPINDEAIIEWRALTVALLDRVAEGVQRQLGKSPAELPLACVLAGGTWTAGRAVAAERRAGGAPPIRIQSDGSIL